MSVDPWSTPLDKFFAIVLASGLLKLDEIRDSFHAYDQTRDSSTSRDDVKEFCEHLVAHDILTRWQCDKLQLGQFQGFFMDQYKILEPALEKFKHYLAMDLTTRQRVLLLLSYSTEDGTIEYKLVGPVDE